MRPTGELTRNVTFWDGAGGGECRVTSQNLRPPGNGLFGYGVCISVRAVVLRAMAHLCYEAHGLALSESVIPGRVRSPSREKPVIGGRK